jgi:transglutaminase/protease-like cytokinesis protein 3
VLLCFTHALQLPFGERETRTQLCAGRRFCHYLKINCCTLNGCARGGQSATGRRMQQELVAHSWNAVNVRNQWRVLDVSWGYE